MAHTHLSIPALGNKFVDLRDLIPGDSYKWSWERDLSQVNYLAIHSTNTPNTSTPQDIANKHVTINGWGGIGYHFLISTNGLVYYVGDISTARANVANLNEQVLGIGLIGNFIQNQSPSEEQLNAAHKLCEFLISFPPLQNVKSWDKVRGHKELPGQSTACPGETFQNWRIQIVEGVKVDPANAGADAFLQSQVSSLQTSLASVNQQLITVREALQQREAEIARLKQIPQQVFAAPPPPPQRVQSVDTTLTLIGALINLYQSLFPARKAEQ